MHPIIYDVAVSADGFIADLSGQAHMFPHEGPHADAYAARLATYKTALMGRATYEFGYQYGLPPGANPYPHMRSYVISASVDLPEDSAVTALRQDPIERITELRTKAEGPVYLCGGGQLAGALLSAGLIDQLVLKRAPIALGKGISLFGNVENSASLSLADSSAYDNGVVLEHYRVINRG